MAALPVPPRKLEGGWLFWFQGGLLLSPPCLGGKTQRWGSPGSPRKGPSPPRQCLRGGGGAGSEQPELQPSPETIRSSLVVSVPRWCFMSKMFTPRGFGNAALPRLAGLHGVGSAAAGTQAVGASVLRALPEQQRRWSQGSWLAWIRPQWGAQVEGAWPGEVLGVGWGEGEAPVQPSLVPGSGLRLPAGPSNFPAQKPFRDGRQPQDELGLISEETRVNC